MQLHVGPRQYVSVYDHADQYLSCISVHVDAYQYMMSTHISICRRISVFVDAYRYMMSRSMHRCIAVFVDA